jgi:hypothetical protein
VMGWRKSVVIYNELPNFPAPDVERVIMICASVRQLPNYNGE